MKAQLIYCLFLFASLQTFAQNAIDHEVSVTDRQKDFTLVSDDPLQSIANIFVAPKQELIVVQWKNLNTEDRTIVLEDAEGREVKKTILYQGSTIAYFDTQTIYNGEYVVQISDGNKWFRKQITIKEN